MSVRRNTIYNLFGSIVPLALSFATVPIYLRMIGPERYGVLAIAWLLLGYFGLFDLGLGRATSYRIAALRGGTAQARSDTLWAALVVNAAMGVVGGLLLWLAADYFFGHVFRVKAELRPEIMAAVPLLALSVPVATLIGVLYGAMQGCEKFLETNVVAAISTALFQILPLTVAWLAGPNLVLILIAGLSSRLVTGGILAWRCHAAITRGQVRRLVRAELPGLLRFGGWVSLVSIFGPLMGMADRFAIGTVLGAVAVTIYTVPYQLASRLALLPSSLAGALFPRMSGSSAGELERLADNSSRTMIALMTMPVFGAIFLMEPFLRLWVGSQIAVESAPIGRIVLVGFWFNAFALVSYVRLEASGRPDIRAKFILAQLPFYLATLYCGLKFFGFEGCAIAFAGKCCSDYVCLTYLAGRKLAHLGLMLPALMTIVVGVYLAGRFPLVSDWRWWVSAGVTGAVLLAVSWCAAPREILEANISRALDRFIPARSLGRPPAGGEM